MNPQADSPGSKSDEALVESYRNGEDAAFDKIVSRYEKELYYFLVRFMGKPAAAEDVFQETFLQVHLSVHTFDLTRKFKPWLFTIAANKGRDYLRRKSQRPLAQLSAKVGGRGSGGDGETEFIDLMESDFVMPDQQVEAEEMQQQVRELVDELPDHLREILLLAYFNRFAYGEIAEMLGIPLGTVKSRLHAAVATFAQQWKHRRGDPEE